MTDPTASREDMHDARFDALLRMVGDYGDVMAALVETLNNWGSITPEAFVEAFTEQIRDLSDLIPEGLRYPPATPGVRHGE